MTKTTRRWELGLRQLRRQRLVSRRTLVVLVVEVLGLVGAWWLQPNLVLRSPSPSLPTGLYGRDWSWRPWQVGDLVVLETPDVLKPALPKGYEGKPLLKQVAAVAGMVVCWEDGAMVVYRHEGPVRYPFHAALTLMRQPEGCRLLGGEDVIVTGQHVRSHDSRYVGPVSRRLLRFRVWPLWTKEIAHEDR